MPEQMLRIEPENELKFKGPFTTPTTSLLKLTNPSDRRICFKIKTTAPKRYCVRPNAGLLEPGASLNIAVVFQPCELEPTANKHKFMVQAIFAPNDGEVNMDQLWKEVDGSKLMDTKLRCSFELPAADAPNVTPPKPAPDDSIKKDPDVGKSAGKLSTPPSEVIVLRNENSQLKDQIAKLSRQVQLYRDSDKGMGVSASPPTFPMLYIVLALVAVLIGLILGKFIL